MESPQSDKGIPNKGFNPEEMDLTDIVDLETVVDTTLDLNTNLFNSAIPKKDSCVALARKMSVANQQIRRQSQVPVTPAVEVRGAMKSYSSKRGNSVILNDFNMTVQEGSIYSLLGSSGCGKTTLLSCCVGVKNLDKGQIKIFGHKPGSRAAGVPGRNVGYMPQEIALYPELSIDEVLLYFGRMFGMSKKAVKESVEFLLGFLKLPPPHRRIGSLSGGQQRRVSFAVALVHSPKLLILDEPTVGVDPLLRQSIWNHLVKLVSSGETTVIITTHFVEEARQSNTIGLMRHGRLLAEDSPENLLRIHSTIHLEEIVLKLCLLDTAGTQRELEQESTSASDTSSAEDIPNAVILSPNKPEQNYKENPKHNYFPKNKNEYSPSKLEKNVNNENSSSYLPSTINYGQISSVELKGVVCEKDMEQKIGTNDKDGGLKPGVDFIGTENINASELEAFHKKSAAIRKQSSALAEKHGFKSRFLESSERIQAMVLKNAVTLLRNIPFLLFMFFTPAFQVIMVCVAIGQDPKGLHFGLVNFDAHNSTNCTSVPGCVVADNYTGSLSCRFLDILGSKGTLNLKIYDNEEDAAKDVELSQTWGYIMFYENYTKSMKERALFGTHAEPEAIYGSRIKFRLDQSNLQIFRETGKVFLESFKEYMKSVSEECGIDPIATEPPIYFAQPIYGADSVSFTDFLAPSMLLAIIFFFPLCGSNLAYITEKKIGTLSRSLVAGVTSFEIMSAYLIVQLILLCVQVALSFLILEVAFHVKFEGPIHCAYLLLVMVGVAGMSMGFLLSVFINDELQAVLVALGTFFPNVIISGLLWPLEGLPLYLQYISKILPCTYAGEAMRSILSRGVSYTHPSVWPGYVSVSVWIVLYWTLNIIFQKCKAKN